MSGPLVRTIPLGGSALARAAAAGAAPDGWYEPVPADPAAWRERAANVGGAAGPWLQALGPAFDARGAAAERLARAARGGVLVTTGQQPGLFGGPAYTWSKALSALALADALEAATGIATAPVFWAATDDADFAEAAETHLSVEGGVQSLRVPPPPVAMAGRPLAELPLAGAGELLDALERAAGSAASPDVLRLARSTYVDGATIGGAYVALLRTVLEPLGIGVLDSSHPSVRAAAFPVLRAALERARAIDDALIAREAAIQAAGHAPQVELVPGLSLVFRVGEGKERVRLEEAAGAARDAAVGSLAPNVLLRPVVERAILPTVAYVAGPGELAYFAQVSAAADALGAARPLAVPRWSGLVVEPHIGRLLERHGLTPEAFEHPTDPERAHAARAIPAEARRALEELRASIDRATAALAGVAEPSGVGAPPIAAIDGARRSLSLRVDRLERRFLAAAKRRETTAMRELATLRGALRPLGRPQERTLNLLPMLARQGTALLDAMLAEARRHAASLVSSAGTERRGAPASGIPTTRR